MTTERQEGSYLAEEPEIVTGSREQLLHLLAEAAEIEHMLMCSYLYAAFSLRPSHEGNWSRAEAEAVDRWRKTIMGVAIEEMGHLLMVANLTVAIGGRPHFARPNFPVAPGYFPADVVVRLSGFSTETLDHFIHLERPRGAPGADSASFAQESYTRHQVHRGLMPSAQDYTTIAHLYDAIRRNTVALADQLGEDGLFIGGVEAQVGPDAVHMPGVKQVDGLDAALRCLDLIVEQGEGSPADRADSHYQHFKAVRQEFAALKLANPSFCPAWPVADNPVLRSPLESEDRVHVENPAAARLLDFACATYGLLLRLLVQSFGRQGADAAAQQKRLIGTAIDLMHLLATACSNLAAIPAGASHPGVHAGMSFTMLRGVEPFLAGAAETTLINEQMTALVKAGAKISDPIASASAALERRLAASPT